VDPLDGEVGAQNDPALKKCAVIPGAYQDSLYRKGKLTLSQNPAVPIKLNSATEPNVPLPRHQ
jgi:hypothetical protein